MKLGLITLPLHTNYGGIIQCYALQNTLEKLGHSVTVLEASKQLNVRQKTKHFILYILSLLRKKETDNLSVNIETDKFINTYIKRTKLKSFSDSIKMGFDGFVVGSDQVWRADFIRDGGSSLYDHYLCFTSGLNVKRVAFSASFGLDEWTYTEKETKKCTELISIFDGVSLRERSGVNLCVERLHYKNSVQLVDPTLLLTQKEYLMLIKAYKRCSEQDFIFSYILDPSSESIELELITKEKTGLPLYSLFGEGKQLPPVEKWISVFRDTKMVITDSFHGCVFSIIFNKPFWVIKNDKGGNSRISTLLSLFGLESRFITPNDLREKNIFEPVDWQMIEKEIDIQRGKAIHFIEQNLQ